MRVGSGSGDEHMSRSPTRWKEPAEEEEVEQAEGRREVGGRGAPAGHAQGHRPGNWRLFDGVVVFWGSAPSACQVLGASGMAPQTTPVLAVRCMRVTQPRERVVLWSLQGPAQGGDKQACCLTIYMHDRHRCACMHEVGPLHSQILF